MKQLLAVFFISVVSTCSYAQTSVVIADAGIHTENAAAGIMQDKLFADARMSMHNKAIDFQSLPPRCKIIAYVTNTDGELLKTKRLTEVNHTLDISRLHPGLYYLTLISKNHRKCFMINL